MSWDIEITEAAQHLAANYIVENVTSFDVDSVDELNGIRFEHQSAGGSIPMTGKILSIAIENHMLGALRDHSASPEEAEARAMAMLENSPRIAAEAVGHMLDLLIEEGARLFAARGCSETIH